MRAATARRTAGDWAAAACAAGFVVILGIAAWWDPSIRTLHAFEALPYIAAAALVLRRDPFGYFLGIASGAFWLWVAAMRTSFVRSGFERALILLRTGHLDRPDVLIAAPAACFTGGLVVLCAARYLRTDRKRARDAALFVAACAVTIGFFVAIFALFAPQYLRLLTR